MTNARLVIVIEKRDPPIYKMPAGDEPILHKFTAFPKDNITILGVRRCPAVTPPVGNTSKAISIFTSTGFGSISVPKFAEATTLLRPDIVISPADLLHVSGTPALKKQLRMAERTDTWIDEFLKGLGAGSQDEGAAPRPAVFAPILPIEHGIQWSYLKHLSEDVLDKLSGIVVYDVKMLSEIAKYGFATLPRLSLDPPRTPQEVLQQVSLGADICLTPFVNSSSDSGVALTFAFPPPPTATERSLPLGIDMWEVEHRASVAPIVEGCDCYACRRHHRAFIQHLLNAKEMLGWTLLQVHNYHVMSLFFEGIRATLAAGGPSALDEAVARFEAAYEAQLPTGTGERPRARGYHFSSVTNQEKYNKPAWQDLNKVATPLGGEAVSRDAINSVDSVPRAADAS